MIVTTALTVTTALIVTTSPKTTALKSSVLWFLTLHSQNGEC